MLWLNKFLAEKLIKELKEKHPYIEFVLRMNNHYKKDLYTICGSFNKYKIRKFLKSCIN